MDKIPLDDIEDNMQLMEDLYTWVDERKDKYPPKKIMGILIAVGAHIGYFHYDDDMDLAQGIVRLINFGKELAEKAKST